MSKNVASDYMVYCHDCRGGNGIMRSTAMLHGNSEFGGLWHCPEHIACSFCEHGDYCDADCKVRQAHLVEAQNA